MPYKGHFVYNFHNYLLKNYKKDLEVYKLTYTAKTQRVLLFTLFLFVALLFSTTTGGYSQMIYLIPILLFLLVAISINYRFKITNRILTFQVRIFNLIVYSSEVSHEQIKRIKFKRIGWSKRSAVVQNNKGFNFRIVDFNPQSIFDDLIGYANDYKVPITKTKDFITLEKMK